MEKVADSANRRETVHLECLTPPIGSQIHGINPRRLAFDGGNDDTDIGNANWGNLGRRYFHLSLWTRPMAMVFHPANRTGTADVTRRNANVPASNQGGEESCKTEYDACVEIVENCKRGDRAAYRRLYDEYHRNVFRLAARMVGVQDAVDVTQLVFLRAYRSMCKFEGRSRFTTWLYKLTVNESLQHLRRDRRWRYHALDWEPMDESHHGEDAERKEILEQAFARVDPELRSIFLLREVEGLSYHDIADALQIPEGTVGSRLNRARRELRQILSDLGLDV